MQHLNIVLSGAETLVWNTELKVNLNGNDNDNDGVHNVDYDAKCLIGEMKFIRNQDVSLFGPWSSESQTWKYNKKLCMIQWRRMHIFNLQSD